MVFELAPNSAAVENHKGENKIMVISKIWQWFANPPVDAPAATILLRLMAGGVFFLGRNSQIRFCQSRHRAFYKARISFSGIYGKLCRRRGDRPRVSFDVWIIYEIYYVLFYHPDDSGGFIDKNKYIFGNQSVTGSARAADRWFLGRFA